MTMLESNHSKAHFFLFAASLLSARCASRGMSRVYTVFNIDKDRFPEYSDITHI
jgi:hypothetical protein